ncbi:glycosyltransferase family A protein [Pilimelia columellifera]|uniref:Glycosyltransferase n=1 Tax=Pilimelia columellifera subsp. columellifera TaxID=706583 RepID=A0ABN3NN35_9ACTN
MTAAGLSGLHQTAPTATRTPDVTVVVAVYNAMPYLTRCLDSLLTQSIGSDRMEIVAVDDGSTDSGARVLARYARRHPRVVRTVRQPNSGGPASPSNRALDLARGRYVFFLGADDYLGPDALRRLVGAADEQHADIVLGRVIGVNGRNVDQQVYEHDKRDISLFDSPLPWALANTKLFRRSLIETHRLRFPEDMPMLSDQPFTLDAALHAGRIHVLPDYDCYFAVRRLANTNITYRTRQATALRCVTRLMEFTATRIEPGPRRDAVHLRHFSWEVANLLRKDFLRLGRDAQHEIHEGVRTLADRYLTGAIRGRLDVAARLPVSVAQNRDLDTLTNLLRRWSEEPAPLVVGGPDKWRAAYAGLGEPGLALPDEWFDVTAELAAWVARLKVTSVRWRRADGQVALTLSARSTAPADAAARADSVRLGIARTTAGPTVVTPDADGFTAEVAIPLDAIVASSPELGSLRAVQATVVTAEGSGAAAVRLDGVPLPRRRWRRVGRRLALVRPVRTAGGTLAVAVSPLSLRRLMRRLRR